MEPEDTKLYKVLGIDPDQVDVIALSEKDISRAYRKAALKWHPDKNQGNADAAAKFSEIFIAYETLTSPAQREKYDVAIRAARTRRKRFEELDAGRQKLREELRRREQAADPSLKHHTNLEGAARKRMQQEIERLRKDVLREQELRARSDRPRPRERQADVQRDAGDWANVRGYAEFQSAASSDLTFEQFEEAVLEGRFAD